MSAWTRRRARSPAPASDFNITDRWFARADARYMQGDADVKLAGAKVGEVQLDPWVVGVGVGTRF